VFWLWIGLGVLLVALGVAMLGSAYVRDDAPGVTAHETGAGVILMPDSSLFGGSGTSFDPTPWLVAGSALIAVAVAPFLLAGRRR